MESRTEAMAADLSKMLADKSGAEPVVESGVASTGGVAPAAQHGTDGPTSIWDEALKSESEVVGGAAAESDVEPEDSNKRSSGYQKLKQQNSELSQTLNQFKQTMSQFGPELQALREQNAYLMQQMQARQAPAIDPNDPYVQLTNTLKPEFQKELNPVLQRLQQMEERNRQLEEGLSAREAAKERAALREQYTNETQSALSGVLFKDAPVEDSGAKDTFSKVVTLLALAEKTTAEEAARKLRKSMLNWSGKFHSSTLAAQKMKAAAGVPRPSPESNTRAEGSGWPTVAELHADGRFANAMKWDIAGRPALRKLR